MIANDSRHIVLDPVHDALEGKEFRSIVDHTVNVVFVTVRDDSSSHWCNFFRDRKLENEIIESETDDYKVCLQLVLVERVTKELTGE